MFYNQCDYSSSDSKEGKKSVTLPWLMEMNLQTRTVGCLPFCCLWDGALAQSWGEGEPK